MPAKNASGRRADGHANEGALQARIVAVTSVAFDRGAQVSTGEEPACGSNDGPEDLSPEASFRSRASRILRAQYPGRVAAGRKSYRRHPARPWLEGVSRRSRLREDEWSCRGVANARHILGIGHRWCEGGPQRKRDNGWVLKTIHPAKTCIDRAGSTGSVGTS
jgi:hypothetical protein